MDSGKSHTPTLDAEFNAISFEKKLATLKDSQESINSCCHWCLQNRQHHKKIVVCWLNVLKRVKVEHRLTLFYLANDVIQYSKRRNYDFVESWGTTLQKATTLVRDDKVKHKILRIFKIWEQRGVYGEEFIADLCGLISASPSTRKGDDTHEFQSTYLIQKIRNCVKLENDTDLKLKQVKEQNPKVQIDSELLISSLKDRAHVDDVEREIEDYTKHVEIYIEALRVEIKARLNLINLLNQAHSHLENDKKDVKLVTAAYRTFGARVKTLKKKLDEKMCSLSSPIPSPDINAPSPSPDSDIDLPTIDNLNADSTFNNSNPLYTNTGYYNPVPPPNSRNFSTNNYSGFMNSDMSFNAQDFHSSSNFGNDQTSVTVNQTNQTQTSRNYSANSALSSVFSSMVCPPPPPAPNKSTDFQYNSPHIPLLPPPMPPFSKLDDNFGSNYEDNFNGNDNSNYSANMYNQSTSTPYNSNNTSYDNPPPQTYQASTTTFNVLPPQNTKNSNSTPYDPFCTNFNYPNPGTPDTSYPPPNIPHNNTYPSADEYNPEEDVDNWDNEPTWDQPPNMETPESPPLFEKEGYEDPIEYHDSNVFNSAGDVDHRILPTIRTDGILNDDGRYRQKDVDRRNLISLTGSPNDSAEKWASRKDQDYRQPIKQVSANLDRDYRVPFDMAKLKLPPPPPPPKGVTNKVDPKAKNSKVTENLSSIPIPEGPYIKNNKNCTKQNLPKRQRLSPRKYQDNTESIDMDMSDDDQDLNLNENQPDKSSEEKYVSPNENDDYFVQPPPFPELIDDFSANQFLDTVNEDIQLGDFDGDLENVEPFPNLPRRKLPLLEKPLLPAFDLRSSSYIPNPNMIHPPGVDMSEMDVPEVPYHDELPLHWEEENYSYQQEDHNIREYPRRGRGGNMRGNFNNRGYQNNWGNRGNEYRGGRGRGFRDSRMPFRGSRGMPNGPMARSNWSARGHNRSWGDNGRGRIDSRGRPDFRNHFRRGDTDLILNYI